MDFSGSAVYYIRNNNWPGFAPAPGCTMLLKRTDEALLAKWHVDEDYTPPLHSSKDLDPVCRDSCVELFLRPEGCPRYFNFEFNADGVCNASSRISRHDDVRRLTPSELASIERVATHGPGWWELAVAIPAAIFGTPQTPLHAEGNAYKCGDATPAPHYASWQPIASKTPNFHLTDYFSPLSL